MAPTIGVTKGTSCTLLGGWQVHRSKTGLPRLSLPADGDQACGLTSERYYGLHKKAGASKCTGLVADRLSKGALFGGNDPIETRRAIGA